MKTSTKHKLTTGEVLYQSEAMSGQLVRAAIAAQLFIRDQLLTSDVASRAMQVIAERNISLQEALTELGWNYRYYDYLRRVGLLLTMTGILDRRDRATLTKLSETSKLPLITMLRRRNMINFTLADAIISTMSSVMKGALPPELALDVLQYARGTGTDFIEATSANNLSALSRQSVARLGKLLIDGKVLTEEQCLAAIENSLISGRKIGEQLVYTQRISPEQLEILLATQQQIHKELLSREDAVDKIRSMST